MILTKDAITYIHYLFTLNYKLALHVLTMVSNQEEPVDAPALMDIGHRALVRTSAEEEYVQFIAVSADEQLRWARKHSAHKHNIDLTIARAIRLTLENDMPDQGHVLICASAHRFIEGPVVKAQATEVVADAAARNRSMQIKLNSAIHIDVANWPGASETKTTAISPVKKVY